MNLTKALATLLICSSFSFATFAQKFGHMHSGELLSQMPEVKSADNSLKLLQDSLKTVGETMVKKFEANYTEYMKFANAGTLSKVEMQKKETALQAEQGAVQEFEQTAQVVIMGRRELLMKPVLEKVNKAIIEVGKEGKYNYIFVKSLDAILFSQDSEDVTSLVKKKLGLN